MLHPESSPLFTPWTDPVSGVTSYILTTRCAPWQQAFYFTNNPVTTDERYMWLYAAYPPSPYHALGLVDTLEGTVRVYPETAFEAESPWVDPKTGEIFWTVGRDILRRGPRPEDKAVRIGRLPDEILQGRVLQRVVTHLTRSADGRLLNIDITIGDRFMVGAVEIETGKVDIWFQSEKCLRHGQFSPTDPTLMMFCEDWWRDVKTGQHHPYRNRLWMIRENREMWPLFAQSERTGRHSHEWWAPDGKSIWCVDYDLGTFQYDLATGKHEIIWPGGTCHSHASADGQHLAGDIGTYQWNQKPCRVAYFNRQTGKEIDIAAALPPPPFPANIGHYYHAHPHPQFVAGDRYVAYTTTVNGVLDLALVPLADLVRLTGGGASR